MFLPFKSRRLTANHTVSRRKSAILVLWWLLLLLFIIAFSALLPTSWKLVARDLWTIRKDCVKKYCTPWESLAWWNRGQGWPYLVPLLAKIKWFSVYQCHVGKYVIIFETKKIQRNTVPFIADATWGFQWISWNRVNCGAVPLFRTKVLV